MNFCFNSTQRTIIQSFTVEQIGHSNNLLVLKMVSKVFAVLFLIISTVEVVRARISVNIDPVELQSLGNVLVETYLRYHVLKRIPRLRSLPIFMLHQLEKLAGSVWQFGIISSSLACGAVLGPIAQRWYDSWHDVDNKQTPIPSTLPASVKQKFNPSQICQNDFGCDRNICWRTCNSDNVKITNRIGWCYSSPDLSAHKYQHCNFAHDCSPCWHCLGVCNA